MSLKPLKLWLIAGGLAVLVLVGVIAALRRAADVIAPEEVRERIVATIQSEARASLLITGSIDLTGTVTVENVKTLLPGLLNLELGSSRAMVQVPGRAYYGFDVRELDHNRIRITGDTVHITVPAPRVLSVDANLQQLRVWSSKGWLRSSQSLQSVERTALQRIDNALARQANDHVSNSAQPRVNSAEAIRRIVRPVVIAAGITHPVFVFELSERLTLE
jgi:hypothetical protein